jgi:hypothetical protein
MPEQDSELAESESSSDGAMEELADIVSGKKPAPPAWERNAPLRPVRSGRLSKIALIIGLVANVFVLPWLCLLGFGFGFEDAQHSISGDAFEEFILIVAASLAPVGAGVVCSVIAMRHARASRRGDTLAVLALIFNLIPVLVGILAMLKGMSEVWSHTPGTVW